VNPVYQVQGIETFTNTSDEIRRPLMLSRLIRVMMHMLLMGSLVLLPACGKGTGGTETGGGDVTARVPAGGVSAPTAGSEPKQISIVNFKYVPDTLTVPAGTAVTWTNQDDMPHTVTSTVKPRALDSEALDTDARFSYVFTEPGTYDYLCTIHPKMAGRIIVEKR
jgi:amicyanin